MSVFWVPHVLLLAVGRPDIPSKFLLWELPLYAGLAWYLILQVGHYRCCVGLDDPGGRACCLSVWMCARLGLVPLRSWVAGRMAIALISLAGLAVLLAGLSILGLGLPARAAVSVVLTVLFSLTAWRHGLQVDEKQSLRRGLTWVRPFVPFRSVREGRQARTAAGQQSTAGDPP